MIKTCILVTGSTGSGKSTLTDSMGKWGHVVHSGDLVRNAAKGNTVESSVAPASLDGIVKNALFDAVNKHQFVIAECFPRNKAQVAWIDELRNMGVVVSVIRTVCPITIRRARVTMRDSNDPARMVLDMRKMDEEGDDDIADGYFTELLQDVGHTVVSTLPNTHKATGRDAAWGADISAMINMAMCVRGKVASGPVSLERCGIRAIEEIQEFIAETNKRFSSGAHALEEITDALFFLMVAIGPEGLGFTGEQLMDMYNRKFSVNVHRAETGNKPSASVEEPTHEDL